MGRISTITHCLILFKIYGLVCGTCIKDWQQYGDYCYIVVAIKVESPNFNDSLSACNNILGNLPTFKTVKDWTDFIAFAMANKIEGVSALGYRKYNTNPNYTSLYNGKPPAVANWGPGQPNSFYEFSVVRYSSNNFWETAYWTVNPLKIVCQQGLVYNPNTTGVQCAEMFRCYSVNVQHRFTTDPFYCGGVPVEFSIGYTSPIYIPSVTEPLYEMMNSTTGRVVMISSTGRDVAVRLGYTVMNKVTYVFSVPFSSTIPYVLIWVHCNRHNSEIINSLVTPLNDEYSTLISAGWIEMAIFYMFPNPSNTRTCNLSFGNTRKSILYIPNHSGVDICSS